MVPLQLDASGQVKFDALARLGQDKDKVSQTVGGGRGGSRGGGRGGSRGGCLLSDVVFQIILPIYLPLLGPPPPPPPPPSSLTFIKVVHSSLQGIMPKPHGPNDPELMKPDEEDIEKVGSTCWLPGVLCGCMGDTVLCVTHPVHGYSFMTCLHLVQM